MKLWTPLIILAVSTIGAEAVLATPVPLDGMAVIVNDSVILKSDIETSTKLLRSNAKKNNQSLPDAKTVRAQVIDKLVMDTLQLQEAKRIGVTIDDTRLDQAIEEMAKGNKQTIAQLRASIESEGIPYADVREQIRDEMTISETRNAVVRRRINILPAEVDSLANLISQESNSTIEYKISDIQLSIDDNNSREAVEKQAAQLVEKLKAGADFTAMAYSFSKGPKALQGGDWGWMRKEEMPTVFADQIHMQNRGTIIGPFMSGVGAHILKITDVKGLETVSLTEVNARHILIKPSVILSDQAAQNQLNGFIRRIKSGDITFGELAEQYSQDPGSAAKFGELGFQPADIYVPEFKEQIEKLPVGQISQPFKTIHGWHIVEVLERKKVDKTESIFKDKAYRILFNRKFNEESAAWIKELKGAAFIEELKEPSSDN
jgi:peptidyl-prolyl cis-trans isomerase SurA